MHNQDFGLNLKRVVVILTKIEAFIITREKEFVHQKLEKE